MMRGIRSRILVLTASLLVALLSVAAVRVDRLKTHVMALSDPALAGRRSGQPGAMKAAQYIFDQFKGIGYDVRLQEFSDNRANVVARFGSADKHIVLGAHYDGQPGFPSASDNAAGVAVLIELARNLKTIPLPISVVFIAFDDEEQGLNGSTFYVEHPIFPLEQVVSAIVFDTMGRSFLDLKQTTLFTLGTEYSAALASIVARHTRPGMLIAGTDLIGPRSDFAAFGMKRIPYLFFSHATHKDYHGAGDKPELLNYAKMAQDAALIEAMVREIAALRTRPVFREPVYPAAETTTLLAIMKAIRTEKKELPRAYQLVFEDMEKRILTDKGRPFRYVAASAMLSLATPQFSPFMLDVIVRPFYQLEQRPEIVRALQEESARWQR